MVKLLKYIKKNEWVMVGIAVALTVLSVGLSLTIPDYMSKITQIVESGGELSEILSAGAVMMACAIGDMISCIFTGLFSARVAAGLSATLREKIYTRVSEFSMEEIGRFSTSSLVTRSTNDVQQITMLAVVALNTVAKAPVFVIWAIIKIAGKGWQWSLVTAIAVAFVLIVVISNIILVTPKFKMIQKLTDNINRVTRENLTGVRVVRAYNAEDYQKSKFEKAAADLRNNYYFAGNVIAYLPASIQFVLSATSLALYWVGAFMIQNVQGVEEKIVMYGNLVTFMAYAIQIIISFMLLSMVFIILPRATVSAERINEVLDTEVKIKDGSNKQIPESKGVIEFRNVSFKYPDAEEKVLSDITFKVNKGQTVAFIGSTGSGKSTLINLVPRFYDVSEGEVLIDGVNVKDYLQHDLHKKIGYVSQKAVLMKGTIKSNVGYGEDNEKASDEDIIHALEIAQGKDIILKEENGIYAEVSQGGTNFSGGQKQRIAIARAICRKPEIFVFDDSFSALDYKTDKMLRTELKKETMNATTLIVAQRIGTVMDADMIIVLDEGKMVGCGTHKELIMNCEVYRQIAYSQLSKEELENA